MLISSGEGKTYWYLGCPSIIYLNYIECVCQLRREFRPVSLFQLCAIFPNWSMKDCNNVNKARPKICSMSLYLVMIILITIIIVVTLLSIIRINSATVSLVTAPYYNTGINCIQVDFLL